MEIPQERNSRRKVSIEVSVETRGCSPVLMAWFSAGRPNASYPIGWITRIPRRRRKWASASPIEYVFR
jgi:hypothetical protein